MQREDSMGSKMDRPKKNGSRKNSLDKMSMKEKLKLKIEKSERNFLVSASTVFDTVKADTDRGAGSSRQSSFTKRKLCQELKGERIQSRKSFDYAEAGGVTFPASPRRSPSFAFQAWTKSTPRPSPSSVQYRPNTNQSLEFYVDRATGLPENCTVSRCVRTPRYGFSGCFYLL
jgi:hypothetical protein